MRIAPFIFINNYFHYNSDTYKGNIVNIETTDKSLRKLHTTSMEIVETLGIRLHHSKLLEIVADHGINVADGKVFFTENQLLEWCSHAPSSFTIHARNAQWNMLIGGDRTEHISYNSGFPFVVDRSGKRRSAMFTDYVNFLKLVHETPYFNMNGGVMVTPEDLANDNTLYPAMLYATLLHSDKCIFGGMGGKEESLMTMEILKRAFSATKEDLISKPRIANLVSSLSPLQFDEKMLDTLMVFTEYGQPVIISPAVMAGSTGPITMAGTIAVSNAESLVGVALSQILRKGTPVIYGSATSNSDMRTGAFTIGTPESALAVKYCARLAKSYNLPCRGGGSLTDAKTVSAQAGFEGMMVQLVANQENINFNFHSAGGLDSYGAMSYEKFATDIEILGRIRYFLDDLNVDDDQLALDTIKRVGVGGEYLTQMHTAQHCRTAPFTSEVSLQGALSEGQDPNDALFEKMDKKIQSLLSGYTRPSFPEDNENAVNEYMRSINIDPDHIKKISNL